MRLADIKTGHFRKGVLLVYMEGHAGDRRPVDFQNPVILDP